MITKKQNQIVGQKRYWAISLTRIAAVEIKAPIFS